MQLVFPVIDIRGCCCYRWTCCRSWSNKDTSSIVETHLHQSQAPITHHYFTLSNHLTGSHRILTLLLCVCVCACVLCVDKGRQTIQTSGKRPQCRLTRRYKGSTWSNVILTQCPWPTQQATAHRHKAVTEFEDTHVVALVHKWAVRKFDAQPSSSLGATAAPESAVPE